MLTFCHRNSCYVLEEIVQPLLPLDELSDPFFEHVLLMNFLLSSLLPVNLTLMEKQFSKNASTILNIKSLIFTSTLARQGNNAILK